MVINLAMDQTAISLVPIAIKVVHATMMGVGVRDVLPASPAVITVTATDGDGGQVIANRNNLKWKICQFFHPKITGWFSLTPTMRRIKA